MLYHYAFIFYKSIPMRNTSIEGIIIFILISTLLIILLIGFVTYIVYRYQQKQNSYNSDIQNLKSAHENEMLQSQVEIQEQTFENISREIHDNIGQKLTLAKLQLNTVNLNDSKNTSERLHDAVSLISEAINDLSDISRSMSSEIILNNGLIKALEFEVAQLNKSSLYRIALVVNGNPVFFDSQKELVLFRIVQEALNNIMKHAAAREIQLSLNYWENNVEMQIQDDGKGFVNGSGALKGTGIANMKRRAELLNGQCSVFSNPGQGTQIKIEIPINEK